MTGLDWTLAPSMTIASQQVGGVIVPVGGLTFPGAEYEVGGQTAPTNTGLVMPVNACLYVVCVQAGSPLVVPGLPLPVVPVEIQPATVPTIPVVVPVVGTTPTITTPPVTTPGTLLFVGTVTVNVVWDDVWAAGAAVCTLGGGHWVRVYSYSYTCNGGYGALAANALFASYAELKGVRPLP
ncbi:MAG TPA: hypothetical protein VF519_18375 [Mycobacteriales bacterium]